MRTAGQRDSGPRTDVWTAREREVLDLIAAGRTNGEIAAALGISFSTAKWHVSELISKAGVESREEVAAYWKHERRWTVRTARATRALLSATIVKVAAATAVLGAGAGAVALSLPSGDPGQASTGTPRATMTPASPQPPNPPVAQVATATPVCSNAAMLKSVTRRCDHSGYPEVAAADKGNCDLSGAVLRATEQPWNYYNYIDLGGCNLQGADLSAQLMVEAYLAGADLRDANVSGANMVFADFTGANLAGADMASGQLQGANFTNANLLGADLTNAIIRSARWKNTTCPDGTNSDANGGTCQKTLWVADFWPGSTPGVPGGWVKAVCAPFGGGLPPDGLCAHSTYPQFAGTDALICSAPGHDFQGADLRWANLLGCDLSNANLAGADLEGAVLLGASLSGANLTGAKLYRTNAGGANLSGAHLDRAVVSHSSFEGAILRGASTKLTLLRPSYGKTICPDGSSSETNDGDANSCANNR